MRVHELAKELKMTSKWLIEELGELGVEVKGHMAALSDEDADKARKKILAEFGGGDDSDTAAATEAEAENPEEAAAEENAEASADGAAETPAEGDAPADAEAAVAEGEGDAPAEAAEGDAAVADAAPAKEDEDAVEEGVAKASESIRGITGVEVQKHSARVSDGKIVEYHANLKLAFAVR